MKFKKLAILAIATLALTACGEHGYEGSYSVKTEDNAMGSMMASMGGAAKFNLGTDYVESLGVRSELDDVIVRESGGKKYLILKKDGAEQAYEIINDNTIALDGGFVKIVYERSPS